MSDRAIAIAGLVVGTIGLIGLVIAVIALVYTRRQTGYDQAAHDDSALEAKVKVLLFDNMSNINAVVQNAEKSQETLDAMMAEARVSLTQVSTDRDAIERLNEEMKQLTGVAESLRDQLQEMVTQGGELTKQIADQAKQAEKDVTEISSAREVVHNLRLFALANAYLGAKGFEIVNFDSPLPDSKVSMVYERSNWRGPPVRLYIQVRPPESETWIVDQAAEKLLASVTPDQNKGIRVYKTLLVDGGVPNNVIEEVRQEYDVEIVDIAEFDDYLGRFIEEI